jgi:lipoprotein LprG
MLRLLTILIVAIFTLTACGAPAPTPPPPEQILSQAVTAMRELDSFRFQIDRDGAPAYIDPSRTIAFRRAEGSFVSPDQADARVRVIAPGLVVEVQMVSVGGRYWETHPLTGEWGELPLHQGFNPAVLFDPNSGFQAILESDLSNLRLEGSESLPESPGESLYRLSADLAGERLSDLSHGLIGPDPLSAMLWISPETYHLHRITLTGQVSGDAEPNIWQLDFWDFNTPTEITPPISP